MNNNELSSLYGAILEYGNAERKLGESKSDGMRSDAQVELIENRNAAMIGIGKVLGKINTSSERREAIKHVIELAREYLDIRTSGELGEPRTAAHNALLDAMRKAGVQFATREHAAQIAHAMMVLDDAGIEMKVPAIQGGTGGSNG